VGSVHSNQSCDLAAVEFGKWGTRTRTGLSAPTRSSWGPARNRIAPEPRSIGDLASRMSL
jgi:hypothetical protein